METELKATQQTSKYPSDKVKPRGRKKVEQVDEEKSKEGEAKEPKAAKGEQEKKEAARGGGKDTKDKEWDKSKKVSKSKKGAKVKKETKTS